MKYSTCLLIILFISACNQKQETVQEQWIKGNEQKKLETIENQFRGFDMAMVETGYRYQKLYWAGQDENWGYADYQLEKIQKAIENGLERRPKRAQSAQHFLIVTLPQMKEALKKRIQLFLIRTSKYLPIAALAVMQWKKYLFLL
ncbi:exported hypothetical protein [Sphingobacterium sp. PM2-P1-29]|nr:exported hypothetical protein [Sphingobacterium sp. PM2-P1-29]